MKIERQSFIAWLNALLPQTSVPGPALIEPDQDWTPPCWKLWALAEDGVAPGHWSLMFQLDYYRSDGDTQQATGDCDTLLAAMGWTRTNESIVYVPRNDGRGNMSLTLFGGSSWRPGPLNTVSPMDRHYLLTLELGFLRP